MLSGSKIAVLGCLKDLDGAISTPIVSSGNLPAACGEGGLALMDEVTVVGSQELFSSPSGDRIVNQKAIGSTACSIGALLLKLRSLRTADERQGKSNRADVGHNHSAVWSY